MRNYLPLACAKRVPIPGLPSHNSAGQIFGKEAACLSQTGGFWMNLLKSMFLRQSERDSTGVLPQVQIPYCSDFSGGVMSHRIVNRWSSGGDISPDSRIAALMSSTLLFSEATVMSSIAASVFASK